MAKQAMIAVKPHTRDRIFLYKRAGVSYDTIISAMVDAYEERLNEHRPQSAKTPEAGTIVYPKNPVTNKTENNYEIHV